jgi:hypothetical protein
MIAIKPQRFALHLAHRHFDLGPGEVLIEHPDQDGRTQHVTVGTLGQAGEGARPTTWMLEHGLQAAAVYRVCMSDPVRQGDRVRHGRSESPGEIAQKEEQIRDRTIVREQEIARSRPVAGHGEDKDIERERSPPYVATYSPTHSKSLPSKDRR